MKYFLISTVIGLVFAGCGDEAPVKDSFQMSKPLSSLVAADFIKGTSQLPSGLPVKLDTVASCQVDYVNEQSAKTPVIIQDKARVGLTGWAANVVKGTVPKEVFVALYGPAKFYFRASPGLIRADVAAAFNKTELKNCGWEAYANLSELPSGTYYMQVIQSEGRTGSSCDTQRTIILK